MSKSKSLCAYIAIKSKCETEDIHTGLGDYNEEFIYNFHQMWNAYFTWTKLQGLEALTVYEQRQTDTLAEALRKAEKVALREYQDSRTIFCRRFDLDKTLVADVVECLGTEYL